MIKLRPKLTVKYIREQFNQVNVFSKFLDIDHTTITNCIINRSTILSPIRENDFDPSVGFAYDNKGRLKMKDFNGSFWGDIFDLISILYRLKVNTKKDFYLILTIIYDAMVDDEFKDVINDDIKTRLILAQRTKLIIDLNVRDWNHNDITLWDGWGLNPEYLNSNYVFPLQNYWVNIDHNPSPKYYYSYDNPCYAYYQGFDELGIANYRLYFPKKSKYYPKFITNNNCMQGLLQLKGKYDAILITKSYKDVLLLSRLWNDNYRSTGCLNVGFVAPPAENYHFSEYDINSLKAHTETGALLSLFDFDYTGIVGANRLKHDHDVPYLFLTDGRFNSIDYKAKDISDYYYDNSEQETLILIEQVLELIT